MRPIKEEYKKEKQWDRAILKAKQEAEKKKQNKNKKRKSEEN